MAFYRAGFFGKVEWKYSLLLNEELILVYIPTQHIQWPLIMKDTYE